MHNLIIIIIERFLNNISECNLYEILFFLIIVLTKQKTKQTFKDQTNTQTSK